MKKNKLILLCILIILVAYFSFFRKSESINLTYNDKGNNFSFMGISEVSNATNAHSPITFVDTDSYEFNGILHNSGLEIIKLKFLDLRPVCVINQKENLYLISRGYFVSDSHKWMFHFIKNGTLQKISPLDIPVDIGNLVAIDKYHYVAVAMLMVNILLNENKIDLAMQTYKEIAKIEPFWYYNLKFDFSGYTTILNTRFGEKGKSSWLLQFQITQILEANILKHKSKLKELLTQLDIVSPNDYSSLVEEFKTLKEIELYSESSEQFVLYKSIYSEKPTIDWISVLKRELPFPDNETVDSYDIEKRLIKFLLETKDSKEIGVFKN